MRPRRFTTEEVEVALRAAGGLRSHAADVLKCSITTITNYIKRSKHLQQVEFEIVEKNLDFCEAQLLKNAKDGKEPSLFKYLDAKGKHRGFGKMVVENVGAGGGPMQHVVRTVTPKDVREMSDDDLADFIRGESVGGSEPD